ncbi:uncharacterized protein LOC135835147 [Planococcus citri]|uniref:uncharacterized protein LOC135835147 n=1 Tax=Planococcus citri TaxID=170843 RepID=UPI0031F7E28D
MYKILIFCLFIYTIDAVPPQAPYYGTKISPDVEIFDPRFVTKKPKTYTPVKPNRKPTTTPKIPTYPSKEPYTPPTQYPTKPPSSSKKPFLTTKVPPVYSWTSKKPLNFPSPIFPSFSFNNTPTFWSTSSTTYQPPRTFTTPNSIYPSSRWPPNPPKPSFFPSSSQGTQGTVWQPKYPSTVGSGPTGTPAWIYPPRPSWPRSRHNVIPSLSTNNRVIEAADDAEEGGHSITGSISEYQAYNEEDGSFKLGFELRNGLSAKVHGYKKNGKLVLEGSYSIFTEDGKPVNIVYKTDENNYRDSEPTIFHLDIPSFDDQSNLDDENEDQNVNLVPTYVPYHLNSTTDSSSGIFNVDQSDEDEDEDDDERFSDLILVPTTQQSDDEEVISTTENLN